MQIARIRSAGIRFPLWAAYKAPVKTLISNRRGYDLAVAILAGEA